MERTFIHRIAGFFGLHKSIVVILGVVLFLELGERLGERFLPIYILAVGGSAWIVGLSNALDNLLGALYSLPGGYLSDRLGYKKSLILFNIISMLGYLIVILFPSWIAILFGAVLFTSWSSVSLPAVMSAISKVLPKEKQTMGVSMHSLIRVISDGARAVDRGRAHFGLGERDGVRIAFGGSFLCGVSRDFFSALSP